MTRLRKKRLAIPVPLGRHLRQQQPAVPTHFDDEAVAPDGDVVGTGDRLERTEERELEIERRQFCGGDGRKARVRAAGGDRTTRDHVAEWLVHLYVPDAAAELTVVVHGDECRAQTGSRVTHVRRRRRRARHVRDDRLARKPKQCLPIDL